MTFILISTLDPRLPWGTLIELQTLTIHDYIHQAWHILPSPNPHSFVHVNNGPPSLSPLDTKVIQWDILKNGICLLELFGGISFGLGKIIQFGILIRKLPLCGEGSISHIKLHVACHDVIANLSRFVANINHARLSMFPTKQHHFVRGPIIAKSRFIMMTNHLWLWSIKLAFHEQPNQHS
jgi:hypothetical protein